MTDISVEIDMGPMPEETKSRSSHSHNQLDQVICQVRFPAQLSIDRNIDRFQDRIRDRYPNYAPEQIVPLGISNPPGAGHVFTSSDGAWSVNVSTGAMSLTTRRYGDWADFESRFRDVFDAFRDVFGVDSFTRIGLRYINAIRPSALDLGDDAESVLRGPVSVLFSGLTGRFIGGSCVLDRELGDGVSSRTMVGTIVFTDNKPGYAIDNDVFTCGMVPESDVIITLRRFNDISNGLFREMASDELCRRVGL